jgi:CDP-glucose 4,6-dehydratase
MRAGFWTNRRVFVTGHTGFKGSWLTMWLKRWGAEVKGYALAPPSAPSLFDEAAVGDGIDSEIGDIRDYDRVLRSMREFRPEVVFHLAAQPLVRLSYDDPIGTYATNVLGTVHVMEAARHVPGVAAFVSVTSDKCYENREWVWGYREDDPMGGHDPYSSSKGCAELVTSAWRRSYFHDPKGLQMASGRAGNVIGGGDWAADRLIPDILRAFDAGAPVTIRNPRATRPWQHVLEPLGGYIAIAEKLCGEDGAAWAQGWNFGPDPRDVRPVDWIVDHMVEAWGGNARWQLTQDAQPHEAHSLALDCSKARLRLGWTPTWPLETALARIVDWSKQRLDGQSVRKLCEDEIDAYLADHDRKKP